MRYVMAQKSDEVRKKTFTELQTENNARCKNCNEYQAQNLVHHSINLNYRNYEIDIPSYANNILMKEVS